MTRSVAAVACLGGAFAALVVVLPALRTAVNGEPVVASESLPATSVQGDAPARGGTSVADASGGAIPPRERDAPRSAPVDGIVTRHALPRDLFEVEQLHHRNRGNRCAALPAESPIHPTRFLPYAPEGRQTEALSSRRTILTIGIDMTRQDRRNLPTLSGGKILDFLTSQYVVIQARILKDPVTGEEYLDHRPAAGIASFAQPSVAVEPQAALAHSLEQYRGVGLFVPAGERQVPANLRTLALLNRTERAANTTGDETTPHYEYVFVRARPSGDRPDDELELFVFGTSDDRTKLHWLHDRPSPRRVDDCTVTTYVRFTQYSYAGLLPEQSVTRTSRTDVRASYLLSGLDAYSQQQGWGDSAFDRLTDLLDAIIDDKIDAKLDDLTWETTP